MGAAAAHLGEEDRRDRFHEGAIAEKQAKFLQRYEVTPDRLIRELSKIAFSNTDDFVAVQDDGNVVIDFGTATREQFAALASIETEEVREARGDDRVSVRKTRFKTHDKLKALTELAKLARMYPAERTELTGANGGPIKSASVNVNHTMDIASLEPEQRDELRQVLLAIKAQASESEEQANRDADYVVASGEPAREFHKPTA
ncbi:MAG: terminase small subunit [Reyranella sp.]